MKIYAVVMLGGGVGSMLRFFLVNQVDGRLNSGFPWGTVLVNIVGCFLIGLFIGAIESLWPVHPLVKAFVVIGVFGGFTTFSSFSLQTILLVQNGNWPQALGNVLISVIACLLATTAGFALVNVLAKT